MAEKKVVNISKKKKPISLSATKITPVKPKPKPIQPAQPKPTPAKPEQIPQKSKVSTESNTSKEIITITKSGRKLTPRQEDFCQLYASEEEFFGNGVQSYIEAYDVDRSKPNWYQTARSCASELLTKPNILERINEIFEAHGLNDQFVDKQLEKLIIQDADFRVKMSAISEYNKLKARITQKIEQTSTIKQQSPLISLTVEELRSLKALKALKKGERNA